MLFKNQLRLDQWYRRCRLEIFFIWNSGGPLFSRTICAILVEGIMRNDAVNLFQIQASGSGGDVV